MCARKCLEKFQQFLKNTIANVYTRKKINKKYKLFSNKRVTLIANFLEVLKCYQKNKIKKRGKNCSTPLKETDITKAIYHGVSALYEDELMIRFS